MKHFLIAAVALAASAAAGCATGADPSPAGAPTSVATRLTETQISANRYRLSYMAPPTMSDQEMKDRTLMGAARLTIDKGNDWFEVADQASGQHKHSLEIVMGKGETLAGGAAKQYDAKELYAQLSGKLS